MLDARCGVAVEQVRKALTVQGEQIDRGRAGRGVGIVRVGPFGALVDVPHAVPVGVLEKIQIADFEPPGQIDLCLHSDPVLPAPGFGDLFFQPEIDVLKIRGDMVKPNPFGEPCQSSPRPN